MRLTKRKAINISIELWEWLVETSSEFKFRWPGWEKYGEMTASCPLCEYSSRHGDGSSCTYCPYIDKFGRCLSATSPYYRWHYERLTAVRQEYAKLFLVQLKQL